MRHVQLSGAGPLSPRARLMRPGPITEMWLRGWDLCSEGLMAWAVGYSDAVRRGRTWTRKEDQCEDKIAKPTAGPTPS